MIPHPARTGPTTSSRIQISLLANGFLLRPFSGLEKWSKFIMDEIIRSQGEGNLGRVIFRGNMEVHL